MSLIDDVLIIALVIWGLSRLGMKVPWWAIGILALVFATWSALGYWALTKNPNLGFENMVGKIGSATEPVRRKGTVRIGHELWQATSRQEIEAGTEITVVSQSGLKLTVEKKQTTGNDVTSLTAGSSRNDQSSLKQPRK